MENYTLIVGILSGVITISTVLGILWKAFRWFDRLQDKEMKNTEDIKLLQKNITSFREEGEEKRAADIGRLQEEIRSVKDESVIVVEGVSACLDGLRQLGANHCVAEAKQKLDEYINIAAHK